MGGYDPGCLWRHLQTSSCSLLHPSACSEICCVSVLPSPTADLTFLSACSSLLSFPATLASFLLSSLASSLCHSSSPSNYAEGWLLQRAFPQRQTYRMTMTSHPICHSQFRSGAVKRPSKCVTLGGHGEGYGVLKLFQVFTHTQTPRTLFSLQQQRRLKRTLFSISHVEAEHVSTSRAHDTGFSFVFHRPFAMARMVLLMFLSFWICIVAADGVSMLDRVVYY